MCTACGRNNSPEWRKVSLFPLSPIPPLVSLASPRRRPSRCLSYRFFPIRSFLRGWPPPQPRPPQTLSIFFRWPTRCVGSALGNLAPAARLAVGDPFAPASSSLTIYFLFCISLRPFASSPIRRLSLFAVPDRPRLGSPRFNMHQNHNSLASHLRLPRNFAFRHAASIAYTP